MARAFLVLFGVGSIAWGLFALFGTDFAAERMGLQFLDGDGLIEFFGINAGLWPAVGTLSLIGAATTRLRLTALVTILVCVGGTAGGRILAMLEGAEPGLYTYVALGLELGVTLLAAIAYGAEKREATLNARAAAQLQQQAPPPAPAPQPVGGQPQAGSGP